LPRRLNELALMESILLAIGYFFSVARLFCRAKTSGATPAKPTGGGRKVDWLGGRFSPQRWGRTTSKLGLPRRHVMSYQPTILRRAMATGGLAPRTKTPAPGPRGPPLEPVCPLNAGQPLAPRRGRRLARHRPVLNRAKIWLEARWAMPAPVVRPYDQ